MLFKLQIYIFSLLDFMEATNHLVIIPENKNITGSFSKAIFRQDYVDSSKMKMRPYFTMEKS